MKQTHPLKVFLDEGVPASVAQVFVDSGYGAIRHQEALSPGVADDVVCAAAMANDAVLVAQDADMKQLAKQYGLTPTSDRFSRLSVIRICCNEVGAASRVKQAISFIEHEWEFATKKAARRMWVDIGQHFLKSHR